MTDTASTNLVEQRAQKLRQLEALGVDPYPHRFEFTDTVSGIVRRHGEKSGEELEQQRIVEQTAGRLLSLRGHGKVGFGHLQGQGVRLQIYVRKDRVGEENYRLFKLLDIGDVIGVRGEVLRTKRGELTIFADEIFFLSKALLPLPEKFHGLTDVELRYRQRYVDLIANPEVREIFVRRAAIIRELRSFLEEEDFLEVETPMMQPLAGGATARPFETFHAALGIPLYLRIAPELYLKRLTVGGFDRVYEINRNFRNEGISTQHNPEFTMLEFYQAYADYQDLMSLTERMLLHVAERVIGSSVVQYGEEQIDFAKFERLTMMEAIERFWEGPDGPDADALSEPQTLIELLTRLGEKPVATDNWGRLLGQLFEAVAEPRLRQPTFIYDYPVELSPLSKKKDSDTRFVERFELYLAGFEVANAYSELNDPVEQHRRFQQQLQQRAEGDQEAHLMDDDYIRALRYGLPPTAGEGIGIDRLAMVLTNSTSIREVILFPQLRPQTGRDDAERKE